MWWRVFGVLGGDKIDYCQLQPRSGVHHHLLCVLSFNDSENKEEALSAGDKAKGQTWMLFGPPGSWFSIGNHYVF